MSVTVRRASTHELRPTELTALRRMTSAAWEEGDFTDLDWEHGTGGIHVVVEEAGEILSHGSVVERTLEIDGVAVRTGYVEAVATWPRHQRRGYATLVMHEIGEIIRGEYALGGLSTPVPRFYERLGWELWKGPTFLRTAAGLERTADDDGGIMILRTPTSPLFDVSSDLSCEWRSGDVW